MVALGGNAILKYKEEGTAEEQLRNVRTSCQVLARLIREGLSHRHHPWERPPGGRHPPAERDGQGGPPTDAPGLLRGGEPGHDRLHAPAIIDERTSPASGRQAGHDRPHPDAGRQRRSGVPAAVEADRPFLYGPRRPPNCVRKKAGRWTNPRERAPPLGALAPAAIGAGGALHQGPVRERVCGHSRRWRRCSSDRPGRGDRGRRGGGRQGPFGGDPGQSHRRMLHAHPDRCRSGIPGLRKGRTARHPDDERPQAADWLAQGQFLDGSMGPKVESAIEFVRQGRQKSGHNFDGKGG